jgi:hypothetical protein
VLYPAGDHDHVVYVNIVYVNVVYVIYNYYSSRRQLPK